MPLWMIVSVSFGASVLAAVPMYLLMKRAEKRAKARLREIAGTREASRQVGARCFGVRSKGKLQVRPGAGGLVLFDDELVYVPLAGKTELRIPRASIVGVARAKGFLGKRTGTAILQVAWKTDGAIEAAAWEVRELDSWIEALGGEQTGEDS